MCLDPKGHKSGCLQGLIQLVIITVWKLRNVPTAVVGLFILDHHTVWDSMELLFTLEAKPYAV